MASSTVGLDVALYKTFVALLLDPAKARAELGRTSISESEIDDLMAVAAGWTRTIAGIIHVYVPRRSPVGVLAHECAHAAARLLDARGVYAGPDDEAFTYLLEHLVEQAAPHVRPRIG